MFTNVYEVMRPRFDSLAVAHPESSCTTRRSDVPEYVDCLRLPVHVGNQTVWTDSLGHFTAPGPFKPGDTIRVWVDESRLPRFHTAPGGRSNCAVNSEDNRREWDRIFPGIHAAHICFPASLLNMQTGYSMQYNSRIEPRKVKPDTMYVVVPETPDTVQIHAFYDYTWTKRLEQPGLKIRIWNRVSAPYNPHHQVYWLLDWEGHTDWNSEIILRRSETPNPWRGTTGQSSYFLLQMEHPTEEWERCVFGLIATHDALFAQLHFDERRYPDDRSRDDCASGMIQNSPHPIARCAPPPLDASLRSPLDGHTALCDRFFGP